MKRVIGACTSLSSQVCYGQFCWISGLVRDLKFGPFFQSLWVQKFQPLHQLMARTAINFNIPWRIHWLPSLELCPRLLGRIYWPGSFSCVADSSKCFACLSLVFLLRKLSKKRGSSFFFTSSTCTNSFCRWIFSKCSLSCCFLFQACAYCRRQRIEFPVNRKFGFRVKNKLCLFCS